MTTPYRELPEKNGADWKMLILKRLAGRSDADHFADLANKEESYRSEALAMIAEAEVEQLLAIYKTSMASSAANSFYQFYRLALGKLITSVIDQYPEAFELLSAENQDLILNMKLETPSLEALDEMVFAYLDGRATIPVGTIAQGRDFESWLRDIYGSSNAKLVPHLSRAFDDYRSYCLKVFGKRI
ncbi:hypothetical protein IT412_03665 [Candidatus Peregrinibacteria bacterium]|nr:hypothetical protein [Candidatus Peregrinibacteria bacterium]